MPKGGARNHSGPPPDPNALRRERDGKEWTKLPAVPIDDETIPDWPDTMPSVDGSSATADELRMWDRLWHMPQARVWLADGVEDIVALYVRVYLEAAKPDASVGCRTNARQLADSLLLTTPALHAARYVIDRPLEGASAAFSGPGPDAHHKRAKASSGARSRMYVVPAAGDNDDDDWDPVPDDDE